MSNTENLKSLINLNKDFLQNAVIFDIGSNVGEFSRIVAENINYKKIHLFEPCKSYFEESKLRLSDKKNIYFNNFALGSTKENQIIYKSKDNKGWNTILKKDPNQEVNFCDYMDSEEIVIQKLDDLNIQELDFIKIDVEGYEAEVISGALETIKKYKPYMLVELGWGKNHPNWEENLKVYQSLFELGYKKIELNFDDTVDVLFEPEFRKLPLSIGILSWNSNETLENTLKSYEKNGLLDICEDVQILFQKVSQKDLNTANKFKIKSIGLSENVGIGKAFQMLATSAKNPNVLLLEHDWELIEDKTTTYKRLFESLLLLEKNFSCIRLRHRIDYGDPLYSRAVYENKELDFFDSVTQLSSPHLLDCIHWKENPNLDYPDKIKKHNDFFVTTSRWGNWTNNPCIYKKDFYLNCVKDFVGQGIELEEKISGWWARQEFLVAQGNGLFKHNDIDKKNKKFNIVDCFPYFNEEELLELRISLLQEKVDKFIICESNRTHSGNEKEFTCKKTLKKLGLESEKIHVLEVDMSSINKLNQEFTWLRERLQRDVASKLIDENDVCFVSDCDEIIDPTLIEYYANISKEYSNNILRVPLVLLSGRADLRVYDNYGKPIVCDCPFFCQKKHLEKYTLSEIREANNGLNQNKLIFGDIFVTTNNIVEPSGWHFTWMGDSLKRANKYESFMHYYDVIENSAHPFSKEKTLQYIQEYKPEDGSSDVLGRSDHVLKLYPTQFLPSKIFEIERIKSFLLPPKSISIVQIGTNKAYDDLSEYLSSQDIKFGLFVEPNASHNESIIKCYADKKNIFIENVAIVPSSYKENELELFYNTGDTDQAISSCKFSHVKDHTDKFNINGEIKSMIVPCSTLESLLDKYKIKNLDWLLLDVEGLDAEILLDFNWCGYRIKRIDFEYLHLNEKRDEICNMFFNLGYKKVKPLTNFDWAFEI